MKNAWTKLDTYKDMRLHRVWASNVSKVARPQQLAGRQHQLTLHQSQLTQQIIRSMEHWPTDTGLSE